MGNNVSVSSKEKAARKLYVKMQNQRAYEQDTKNMKYTKIFLEKATLKGLESILKSISKYKMVSAAFCMTGLGATLFVGCIIADQFLNSSENATSGKITEIAIRKVLHEEQIQEISNIVIAYQNHYKMFANNKKKLCEEATICERDLFNQLNRTSQNMLKNRQSATVSNFLAWLKGARIHLEVLSDMITLRVGDPCAVYQAAQIHCSTMSQLVHAVKEQKASVITLFQFPLGIKLTDKEAGQFVCIYYPHFSFEGTKDIKDKYLMLLFDDQLRTPLGFMNFFLLENGATTGLRPSPTSKEFWRERQQHREERGSSGHGSRAVSAGSRMRGAVVGPEQWAGDPVRGK
ncbi:uncharacterized protein LOC109928638 [Rhincodon typus]|uniref:uncharacterized protein LOC109928638 n=1 Tax=Rhincodon typus TaxID=259920 RepID=UPI0020304B07|nr:uncharacterized protein LOC109928638 [Rhincodon typus]XP_048473686.1 uncharacterized protein LOC109928638 [Rhincodon typus]